LNPELLVICGEAMQIGGALLDPVVDAIRSDTFASLGRDVAIAIEEWGDEAWAVGAATLVLRESFRIPESDEHGVAIWRRLGA
jgi:hypothetical protein